jgi:hypothetical protein
MLLAEKMRERTAEYVRNNYIKARGVLFKEDINSMVDIIGAEADKGCTEVFIPIDYLEDSEARDIQYYFWAEGFKATIVYDWNDRQPQYLKIEWGI